MAEQEQEQAARALTPEERACCDHQRWLAELMIRWASQTHYVSGEFRYPSLVGYLLHDARAAMSEEELKLVDEALDYRQPDPV